VARTFRRSGKGLRGLPANQKNIRGWQEKARLKGRTDEAFGKTNPYESQKDQ